MYLLLIMPKRPLKDKIITKNVTILQSDLPIGPILVIRKLISTNTNY